MTNGKIGNVNIGPSVLRAPAEQTKGRLQKQNKKI